MESKYSDCIAALYVLSTSGGLFAHLGLTCKSNLFVYLSLVLLPGNIHVIEPRYVISNNVTL